MARGTPRWWKKLLGVLVALAVLAGAGELALRLIVPGVIENTVRTQLKLSGDHPVDVSLGGSALLNALRGGIGDVRVGVPEAPIRDGIVADAELTAGLVPFNPLNGEIRDGDVRLTVPQDQLGPFVSLLTKGVATTGEVRDGNFVIGRSISFLGQEIPLTISLAVSVSDGNIVLEPTQVSAAGLDLTAEQITQATGTLLDPVLHPEPVCVRDQLPAGVTITEITLSSTGSAMIDASLSPGIVSDPAQRAKGSCE